MKQSRKAVLFSLSLFWTLITWPPSSDLMGSLAGVGEGSSYFCSYGSQKEALARAHSRWSLWESIFVWLGRCRSGMGSDLYLAPVPFIASICQENLTSHEYFHISSGVRPGLGVSAMMLRGTFVRGSWEDGLRLENNIQLPILEASLGPRHLQKSCSWAPHFIFPAPVLFLLFCWRLHVLGFFKWGDIFFVVIVFNNKTVAI